MPTNTNGTKAADIFSKAFDFKRADEVKATGLYPYFKPLTATDGTVVEIEGHTVIMAGSNNYLGLTNDPRVMEAAKQAISKYGTGCTGSRYLNGTLDLHLILEAQLAEFMGKEACVLFSTGYQTNEGSIQTIAGRNDVIFSDKDNHACIVVGTKIRTCFLSFVLSHPIAIFLQISCLSTYFSIDSLLNSAPVVFGFKND
jgi:8-amino-7-oxononanoate synthase